MQKRKIVLLLTILVGAFVEGRSQNPYNTAIGQVSIVSPTAASLGKFGDIPVNKNTGIPDINIPIYVIKNGPIVVPVALSYHASGMKVQEQGSWVGDGWSLDAGGVITRTVVGGPDDRGFASAYCTKGYFSDYGVDSYLFGPGPAGCNPNGPATCPVGRAGMPTTNYPAQDQNIMAGIFDGEPDLYFFNFNGHTGKFYFNDDRTPVIEPEQDMQITPIYTGTDWRGMTGFIVTLADGIKYYFGQNTLSDGNPDAIEVTYDLTTQLQYNGQGAVSAWYLNKIVSADGQFADTLIYQTESYACYGWDMYPIPEVTNPAVFAYNYDYDLSKNFTNGVRLSKIKFADGEVDFTPGALRQDMALGIGTNNSNALLTDQPNNDPVYGARALGSISIKSSSLCKKDSFYTSYWYDNTPLTGGVLLNSYPQFQTTTDEYRLRLDSIQEISCDGSMHVPPYKFAYYPGTVPRKLSMAIDHWGFYNGATNNADLIPTYTIAPAAGLPGQLLTTPGADRDTHWPYSEDGVLEQITYPTGGYTQFTYESNSVYTSTPVYTPKAVLNMNVGWDNLTTVGNAFTTNYDTYELIMSSTQPTNGSQGTGGTLELLLNGFESQDWGINAGQSDTTYFTLPANTTYTPEMIDNNNNQGTGSSGIFATLYDLVPSTVNGNTPVGGTRIKTITNNDGMTANNVVTNYQYTFNNVAGGQSSGQLYSIPTYIQEIRNDAWATVNGASCSSVGCAVCFGGMTYYKSPSSIRPMAQSNGSHIGYAEVDVSQPGNGYTDYQYYSSNGTLAGPWTPPLTDVCIRSIANYCQPGIPNSPAPPVPFDPQLGELASEAQYNSSGNLVRTVNYIPSYQLDSLTTPGEISAFYITGYTDVEDDLPNGEVADVHQVAVGLQTITEYNLQSSKRVKDSVVTRIYDPVTGNSQTDIKTAYYTSRYHHAPTQILTYTSSGQTLVSNFTNAFDFRISNFNVADQLPTYYTNINGDLIWMTNAFNHITLAPTDPNYFWERLDTFTSWRYRKVIDRQTYLNWRLQTYGGSSSTYATDHASAETTADGELKPVLVMQDAFQNPLIEKNDWNSGKLIHSEYTHHDFSLNPSNAVYPYNTQLVNLQAPSATFTPAAVSGNTIAKDSRYALESSVTWSLGNVQQTTPHNGVTNTYIWDYMNSLPVAMVVNAAVGQTAYTSFESNGKGNWTIPGSADGTHGGFTGNLAYNLNNGTVSCGGLTSSATYVVSYWTTASTANTVAGTTSTLKGKSITINGTLWTYFEHTVTGVTSASVAGTSYIDELRLYPSNAQMTTYTYNLLEGMSAQCDVDNRVTYYYYDSLGRLRYIKDQDGNVVKTIEYHYMNQ